MCDTRPPYSGKDTIFCEDYLVLPLFFFDAKCLVRPAMGMKRKWSSLLALGQCEDKLQSAARSVLGGDGTAVDMYGILHNGQPQPGAAQLA